MTRPPSFLPSPSPPPRSPYHRLGARSSPPSWASPPSLPPSSVYHLLTSLASPSPLSLQPPSGWLQGRPTKLGITQSFSPSFPVLLSLPRNPLIGPVPPPAPALLTHRRAARSSPPSWALHADPPTPPPPLYSPNCRRGARSCPPSWASRSSRATSSSAPYCAPLPSLPPVQTHAQCFFQHTHPTPSHLPTSPCPSPYLLAGGPQGRSHRVGHHTHQGLPAHRPRAMQAPG